MKPLVLVLCTDVHDTMLKFAACPCAVSKYSEARVFTSLCDYKIYHVADDPRRLMSLVIHEVLSDESVTEIPAQLADVLGAGLRRGARKKCT